MFVYFIKKITLTNQKKIYCLSWSSEYKFIAVGADSGLLKVLKLDNYQILNKKENETNELDNHQSKFLSINQTLEGHTNSVIHLSWNDKYGKLISSDMNGLIIVWIFYKGNYYEEMINNRNRSVIIDVKWSVDGEKIVIVFENGYVIVGSVEGHRLWAKEITKTVKLTCTEWSPDGKFLLFGLADGQVECYDYNGNFFTKINLLTKRNQDLNFKYSTKSNDSLSQNYLSVVDMSWYQRVHISNQKSKFRDLAIAFSTGEIHLLINENDEDALVIQTDMNTIKQVKWNPFGNILAVCGSEQISKSLATEKNNYIKFYDKFANLCYNLKVPGDELMCCSWSKCGFKIALAVDNHILLADVRSQCKWVYFADTFIFSLHDSPSSQDQFNQYTQSLVFYQIKHNKMITKIIPELLDLSTKDQYCCIATNSPDEEIDFEMKSILQLCNSIGTTIDTINIDFKVRCLTMNSSRAISCSEESFCIWKFNTPMSLQKAIDSTNVELSEFENYDKLFNVYLSKSETKINCCTCSDKILVIGLMNSMFLIYTFPRASLAFKLNPQITIPKKIALNLNSDQLAILFANGKFNLFELKHDSGKLLKFNREDCWDFKWSCDNSSFLALNEKSKLFMINFEDQFNSEEKQELIGVTHGYLCDVKNLEAKVIDFDNFYINIIEKNIDIFQLNNYINIFESDLLKKTKSILNGGDFVKIKKFIEQYSHHTLWTLLENFSLKKLNFEIAELALVKSCNFKGIQFLKWLKKLNDQNLQRAEVHLYLGEYEQALEIYQQIGRLDLEINTRKLFGDWEALLKLMKNELGADQTLLSTVYDGLGHFFFEKQKYLQAIDCFKKSNNHEFVKICLIRLEMYDELKELSRNSNSNDLLLAQYLESIGLCEQAVAIYLKCGKKEKAIDCAILLNDWQKAIELAQENSFYSVDSLLETYVDRLKNKKQDFAIVELFRKAKNYSKAIKYLFTLIDKMKSNGCNLLKMKKMYVILGILFEEKKEYESKNELETKKSNDPFNKLNCLLESNFVESNKIGDSTLYLNDIWRGTEAIHFYILAQKQLFSGNFDAAMKISLFLIDYEQFIDTKHIYSLIALASALNHNFYVCSKAFIKLELSDDENVYKKLASEIFSKHPPQLSENLNKIECPFCGTKNYDFNTSCSNCETKFNKICVASGRQLFDRSDIWTCKCCKHSAIKHDIISYHSCPLCHCSI